MRRFLNLDTLMGTIGWISLVLFLALLGYVAMLLAAPIPVTP